MKSSVIAQIIMTFGASVLLVACTGPSPQVAQIPPGCHPADMSNRPAWVNAVPDTEGGPLVFVGLSNPQPTERNAREDAMRDAVQSVVNYEGISAQSKYEQALISFGLSSEVIDPTVATRSFQKQLSKNVATQLKAQEWYEECQQTATGLGYVAFVKAEIPVSSVNTAFQQAAQDNLKAAQDRARRAATDQARRQADQASKFWADMAEQGLLPDNRP